MIQTILGFTTLVSVSLTPISIPVVKTVVVEKSLNLNTRTPSSTVNGGFADNIQLSLHYLKGDIEDEKYQRKLNWDEIRRPFEVSFTLLHGEIFAFHPNVLPEFKNPVVTMNSHFITTEGYKSVAGLGGNGVCHLASLINWVASEASLALASNSESRRAGLKVISLVDHNFYPVNGVPKEYGTSIKSQSKNQNLYIKNNLNVPVVFYFQVNSSSVDLKILR